MQFSVRWICRVDGNINSLTDQEILAAHYVLNHKRGQILQQDVLFLNFSLHMEVPEGDEGQDAPGLASPVTQHEHY